MDTVAVGDTTTAAPAVVSEGGTPPSGGLAEPTAAETINPEVPTDFASAAKAELATRSERADGAIPQSRHKEILESARAESRAAAEKEFQERLRPFDGIPAEEAQAFREAFQEYQRDPLTALQRAAQAQPEAIRSWAAKILSQGRQQRQEAAPDPMPAPDVQDANGQAYSQQGLAALLDWNRRQVLAEAERRIQPLLEEHKARQEQQRHADQEREAREFAQTHYDDAKTWPHFETHRAKIVERWKALPAQTTMDLVTNLHRAYREVVVPHLVSTTTQHVVTDLGDKATRGSTTHPSRGSASTPAPVATTFRAALAEELSKAKSST